MRTHSLPPAWSAVAGGLLVLEAVAMTLVLALTGRRVVLPVEAFFAGAPGRASAGLDAGIDAVHIADIELGPAVVVLCLLVAAARFLDAAAGRRSAAPEGRNTARWVEYSLTASITAFLVAGINGIVDVTTLVLVYAATNSMALSGLLQQRVESLRGHPKLALCFGAALGIVPWGIVAFQQIGAGLAGFPPPVPVRVLTLVMLAFAAAFAVTQWRERPAPAPAAAPLPAVPGPSAAGSRPALTHVTLSFASTSVFAWVVVIAIVLPA